MGFVNLNSQVIKKLINFDLSIKQLKQCLIDFSQKKDMVVQPLRSRIDIKKYNGLFLSMPCYYSEYLGIKLISMFPDNIKVPSHQGLIIMFDRTNGSPQAFLDAEYITGVRTSLVSAIATEKLASDNSKNLCIFGYGVQAKHHLESHIYLKSWENIFILGRDSKNFWKFIDKSKKKYPKDNIIGSINKKETLKMADVICTVTSSKEPILSFDMLKKGFHLNLVGAPSPNATEIDVETMRQSKVVVDCMEAAKRESGDIIKSNADIVCELGHLLHNPNDIPIKRSDNTVFKSLGLAIEDVVMGGLVLKAYYKK